MRNRHLQKRARTVRTLLKSLSANYRNGCPHITEKGVRELVKPAGGKGCALAPDTCQVTIPAAMAGTMNTTNRIGSS